MNNDNNISYLPKIVHTMRANSAGDIVELLNLVNKNKYGDIFDKPLNDYLGNTVDLVYNLLMLGVHADNIEDNKLCVSKDGVNIEVVLVDGETKVISLSNQILFLLKEIKREQQEIFERTINSAVERISGRLDDNEI